MSEDKRPSLVPRSNMSIDDITEANSPLKIGTQSSAGTPKSASRKNGQEDLRDLWANRTRQRREQVAKKPSKSKKFEVSGDDRTNLDTLLEMTKEQFDDVIDTTKFQDMFYKEFFDLLLRM